MSAGQEIPAINLDAGKPLYPLGLNSPSLLSLINSCLCEAKSLIDVGVDSRRIRNFV